jgi:Mitochondrial ribosomal protein L31
LGSAITLKCLDNSQATFNTSSTSSETSTTMFGAFRPTNSLSGGLLWYAYHLYYLLVYLSSLLTTSYYRKIPWRLSKFQKARQRKRLRAVDSVVATLYKALEKKSITTKSVERWKDEMPVEQEMVPKDKYTIFDRKEKKYRKSIRSEFSKSMMD